MLPSPVPKRKYFVQTHCNGDYMEHAVGRQESELEPLRYRDVTELQDVVRFLILHFLTVQVETENC